MDAFPHAVKAEKEFANKLAAYERTFQALRNSMRHLLSTEEECSLLGLAALVERLTRQRALDQLLTMIENGTSH